MQACCSGVRYLKIQACLALFRRQSPLTRLVWSMRRRFCHCRLASLLEFGDFGILDSNQCGYAVSLQSRITFCQRHSESIPVCALRLWLEETVLAANFPQKACSPTFRWDQPEVRQSRSRCFASDDGSSVGGRIGRNARTPQVCHRLVFWFVLALVIGIKRLSRHSLRPIDKKIRTTSEGEVYVHGSYNLPSETLTSIHVCGSLVKYSD